MKADDGYRMTTGSTELFYDTMKKLEATREELARGITKSDHDAAKIISRTCALRTCPTRGKPRPFTIWRWHLFCTRRAFCVSRWALRPVSVSRRPDAD